MRRTLESSPPKKNLILSAVRLRRALHFLAGFLAAGVGGGESSSYFENIPHMEITGIVQKGSKRAAALGYPTINIPLRGSEIEGIYAARVFIDGDQGHVAAAFADQSRKVLEAHLLDFSADLYDTEVRIELYEKIRDAAVYRNDEDLKHAIRDDIDKVRTYFKN